MEDLNLHILFFSVLLACAQSYIHMSSQQISEEEVNCDEAEDFSKYVWSKFENHAIQPEVTKDIEPIFHLYRRGSILDHLVVLIHGFGSRKAVWAASMKEAIFKNDQRENLAVLTVDWKKGASSNLWDLIGSYNKAAANTRYIGLATHRSIQCLQTKNRLPKLEVHCIGHSLGAHVCGFVGNALESSTGSKMFRVTGLDPAGPQFTTKVEAGKLVTYKPLKSAPREQRLDETDARVVDIIHTDGNQWGTMRPIGDVDFYVGKTLKTLGSQQAGCASGDLCDHSKSIELFSRSLEIGDKFKDILECQMESKLADMRRGNIFGLLVKESVEEEKDQEADEWGDWDGDWGEEEDEELDLDIKVVNCKQTEAKPKFGYFYENLPWELDSRVKSKKTTSKAEALDASATTRDGGSTPTTMLSEPDECFDENHLHVNTEANYHIRIGSLSLSKTDMIMISVVGAALSFALTFLIGHLLVRRCQKAKQPTVPDASKEVLLPV